MYVFVTIFTGYAFFQNNPWLRYFGKYTKTTFGNVAEEKAVGGCGRSGWDSGSWVFPPSSLLGRIQLLAIFFGSFCHKYWNRIRIGSRSGSRRAKMTHKYRKSKELSCFEVLNVLFWCWRLHCSLCVLYGGLRISKLQFSIQKIKFYSCNFFLPFLVIKTLDTELDPDPDPQCWIRIRIISMRIHNPAENEDRGPNKAADQKLKILLFFYDSANFSEVYSLRIYNEKSTF